METMIQNKRLTEEEFLTIRKEFLRMWPTGQDVELD